MMNFGEITLSHYLALSSLLFLIGLAGVILRRSLLIIMMSLELLLNAAVGRFQGLPDPQVAVFFVITVAAAEVSLGLAILVAIFRIRKTTAADQLASLRF